MRFGRTSGSGPHGFVRMSEKPPARPPRVYVPELAELLAASEENPKKEISLRKEERDHVRSRRLRDGDEVIALDGKGARALAVLARGGAAIALLPSKKISSSSSFPSSSHSLFPASPRIASSSRSRARSPRESNGRSRKARNAARRVSSCWTPSAPSGPTSLRCRRGFPGWSGSLRRRRNSATGRSCRSWRVRRGPRIF